MNESVKSNLYLIHMDNELYHHGIKGMKWGVRRYQNPDGSLTEEGKKRKRRRLIVAGVITAGAAALTIGAIAAGSASRNLNTGRKIMANENVRNTTVSSISDTASAARSTGRKRYGLFSIRRDDGTRSTIHRTYGDYNKGTFYNSSPAFTTWFSTSAKAKTKDGRVINDLYVTAPWSTTAHSTGRKVKPDRYNGKFLSRIGNQSTWHYKPTKVKLKDGRVINVQPIAPWTVKNYSTGRKVLKKK